ncbi:MAG: V-type ATP synthase subunit F [Thermoplasmatota archaeon]
MSEIAVVGREAFTLGFRLAGIRKIHNTTAETLEQSVRDAMRDADTSILVMETSDVSKLNERLREELVSSVKPTLVSVGVDEDNTLREKVKQAVGVDLW